MSSTNRGQSTEEEASQKDNYETPKWCYLRIAEELELPGGAWLEPCAGNGRLIESVLLDRGDVDWTAVEIRPECMSPLLDKLPRKRVHCPADFLEWDSRVHRGLRTGHKYFDVIFTNPPFSKCMEILSKSLVLAHHVVIVQRLNWLGSGVNNGKNDFLRGCMPDIYVLPDRVKFLLNGEFPRDSETGHKKAGDSIEYAWFHWGPDLTRFKEKGTIRNLLPTPKEIRALG